MKIGILAAGISPAELLPQHGSYADMFVALLGAVEPQFSFRVYEVRHDEFPTAASDCDGWVITGSACGVYDSLPWMGRLKELIREIYNSDRPLVGICFGHQIVASAFGARVEKFEGGWGLGRQKYRIEGEHGFADSAERDFTLNAIHQDQVLELPKNARLFASSDFCPYAGLVYGEGIFTLQAHPEFRSDFEADLLQLRRGKVIPAEVADAALATLVSEPQVDSDRAAQWIIRFFKARSGV